MGIILKVIAYLVFAWAAYILVKILINPLPHFTPPAGNDESYKNGYILGSYVGYYGAPVFNALIGWLLLWWGGRIVKRAKSETEITVKAQ